MQAVYGDLRSWKREFAAEVAEGADRLSDAAAPTESPSSQAATNGAHPPDGSAEAKPDGAADAGRSQSGATSASGGLPSSSRGAYAPVDTEAAAATAAEAGCLDVTLALQFQVQGGEARLPAAACKGSLLGFADLAPEGRKHLYVAYRHGETFYEVEGAAPETHCAPCPCTQKRALHVRETLSTNMFDAVCAITLAAGLRASMTGQERRRGSCREHARELMGCRLCSGCGGAAAAAQ